MLVSLKDELIEDASIKATECNLYVDSLVELQDELQQTQKEFKRYDLADLKENHLKYEMYAGQLQTIQKEIDELDREIGHKQTHLNGIGSL